jgi:hypothetical protein
MLGADKRTGHVSLVPQPSPSGSPRVVALSA